MTIDKRRVSKGIVDASELEIPSSPMAGQQPDVAQDPAIIVHEQQEPIFHKAPNQQVPSIQHRQSIQQPTIILRPRRHHPISGQPLTTGTLTRRVSNDAAAAAAGKTIQVSIPNRPRRPTQLPAQYGPSGLALAHHHHNNNRYLNGTSQAPMVGAMGARFELDQQQQQQATGRSIPVTTNRYAWARELKLGAGQHTFEHQGEPGGRSRTKHFQHLPFTSAASRVLVVNPMQMVNLSEHTKSRLIKSIEGLKRFSEQWFSHLLLLIFLVVYACAGAYMFISFEAWTEESEKQIIIVTRLSIINDSWYDAKKHEQANFTEIYTSRLEEYERLLSKAYSAGMTSSSTENQWTFWGALFYSMTVITTIGYGHLTPITFAGRVATMVYALFGIPIVLMVLADLGKLLAQFIKFTFKQFRNLYNKCMNRKSSIRTRKMISDNTSQYIGVARDALERRVHLSRILSRAGSLRAFRTPRGDLLVQQAGLDFTGSQRTIIETAGGEQQQEKLTTGIAHFDHDDPKNMTTELIMAPPNQTSRQVPASTSSSNAKAKRIHKAAASASSKRQLTLSSAFASNNITMNSNSNSNNKKQSQNRKTSTSSSTKSSTNTSANQFASNKVPDIKRAANSLTASHSSINVNEGPPQASGPPTSSNENSQEPTKEDNLSTTCEQAPPPAPVPISNDNQFPTQPGPLYETVPLSLDGVTRADVELTAIEGDQEDEEEEEDLEIPVTFALFLLVAYMMLGAVVFSIWEGWHFFDSLYFVFISMSTIGFGDLVPQHPKRMVGTFIYLLFGLALTSMCINVVQGRIHSTFVRAQMQIGEKIGLDLDLADDYYEDEDEVVQDLAGSELGELIADGSESQGAALRSPLSLSQSSSAIPDEARSKSADRSIKQSASSGGLMGRLSGSNSNPKSSSTKASKKRNLASLPGHGSQSGSSIWRKSKKRTGKSPPASPTSTVAPTTPMAPQAAGSGEPETSQEIPKTQIQAPTPSTAGVNDKSKQTNPWADIPVGSFNGAPQDTSAATTNDVSISSKFETKFEPKQNNTQAKTRSPSSFHGPQALPARSTPTRSLSTAATVDSYNTGSRSNQTSSIYTTIDRQLSSGAGSSRRNSVSSELNQLDQLIMDMRAKSLTGRFGPLLGIPSGGGGGSGRAKSISPGGRRAYSAINRSSRSPVQTVRSPSRFSVSALPASQPARLYELSTTSNEHPNRKLLATGQASLDYQSAKQSVRGAENRSPINRSLSSASRSLRLKHYQASSINTPQPQATSIDRRTPQAKLEEAMRVIQSSIM